MINLMMKMNNYNMNFPYPYAIRYAGGTDAQNTWHLQSGCGTDVPRGTSLRSQYRTSINTI